MVSIFLFMLRMAGDPARLAAKGMVVQWMMGCHRRGYDHSASAPEAMAGTAWRRDRCSQSASV
jgi:hypothetical protein